MQSNPIKSVVRLFFDILHGIDRSDIPLIVALEFAILLGYDGQMEQNSDLEVELFQCTINQLKRSKMTKVENALMWLYVKTWGMQGQHVIEQKDLWNFGAEDLETAFIRITYPRKKKMTEKNAEGGNKDDLVESFRKLIMEKFDEKREDFFKWSQTIHDEVFHDT